MRSSRTITLFTLQPEPRQGPSSFVASSGVHAAAIALVLSAFIYAPQFKLRTPDVYMMQHINLNIPYPPVHKAGGSGSSKPQSSSPGMESAADEKLAAPPSSRMQAPRLKFAKQTLIEPDVDPDKMLPKEVPLPAMLLWSGHRPKVQVLTPPPPQPSMAFDKPKLNFPNKEVHLADLNMASTKFQSALPMPMPSNTSPVVVKQEAPVQRVPETTSVSNSPPTPAAVLSASDLHMAQGTVVMPGANQAAPGNEQGSLGTGATPASLIAGNGASGSTGTEKGAGKGQGPSGGKTAGSGNSSGQKGSGNGPAGTGRDSGSGGAQGTAHNSGTGPGPSTGPGSGQGEGSVTRITLPRNGQFGVVVVGSELDEQFPETADVWKGRLAYSVYLHVGLAKSWILQYSLPHAGNSAGGEHLEAPWPYYIVRPNLNPDDADSDAVMVHGFVNETGHFETLSVVFPTDLGYARQQLVLTALQQWQFRAGTQNGQVARLEVLLIIPEVAD